MDEGLIGDWRLISQIERNASGEEHFPRGEHPVGLLIYEASGRMAVQLMRREPSGDLLDFSTALRQYLGYYGRYSVDTEHQIVTHHLEACSYLAWVGTDQARQFAISEDSRYLTLTSTLQVGEETVTRTLVWERITN